MTAQLDLAAIRARCAAATPGPWGRTTSNDAHWLREVRDANGRGVAWCGHEEKQAHDDAAFIAHARQDIPALVEEVERLRAKVSDMRSEAVRAEERHKAETARLKNLDSEIAHAICGPLAREGADGYTLWTHARDSICSQRDTLRADRDRLAAELERVKAWRAAVYETLRGYTEGDPVEEIPRLIAAAHSGSVTLADTIHDAALDERDALRAQFAAVEAERDELHTTDGWVLGQVRGAQRMREMLARFVEQGGDAITAASIRANWMPLLGPDPGRPMEDQ